MMLWKAVSLLTLVYILSKCEACNETHVGADSGVLQSPNFPHNYPNEAYCSWNIRVNQSQHVLLMFSSSFSLQAENNTDVIRVYDGGNTTGEVLGVFYGGHPPPQGGLYSSANQMFVVFKTDNNKSFSGFQASYHALTCSDPLGMESGAISDAQISASSHYTKNWRRDYSAKKARLNSRHSWSNNGCWAAATNNLHQWLQVDLGGYTKVTRVATQGSGYGLSEWVTQFKIQYSSDGVIWQFYKEPGNSNASAKVFTGNSGVPNRIVYKRLNEPILARYIRVVPVAWFNHITMRVEIYGCQGCMAPLGMENGAISDAQISASSQWDDNHGPHRARLNRRRFGNKRGAWSSLNNDIYQWLQVDLTTYTTVTRIATQGRSDLNQWVTKYRLQKSEDGVNFHFYKALGQDSPKLFDGNKDRNTIVYQTLSQPIRARYVRILPEAWYGHISMRMELYGCSGCIAPLGMESRTILDAQISASSQMDSNHSASHARLHLQADGSTFGGWSALTNDVNQWLQVDFGSYTLVTRIATQGENGYSNWVTKYKLKYSDDGTTFQFYKDVGGTSPKVFSGNTDSETVVYNKLPSSIKTRFIRLLPTQWRNQISMRIEVYGCPGCITPAGMESGAISDFQISASSQKTDSFAASRARLNVKVTGIKQGGWSPLKDDLNQWLQVDLSSYTTVTRLATQGRDGSDEWVTKYKLQYSVDGVIYHFYKGRGESSSTIFDGNQDSNTIVYNKLNSPITVRLVRLLPIEWRNHICLRMEIYGCPGCIAPLGMENGAISDAQISASSQWDNYHGPRRARLNGKRSAGNGVGAWCAITNDIYQWLQVDLRKYTTVTRIATQGRSDLNQWVTKYRLQYSEDGVNFHFYKALGQDSAMLFDGNKDRNTIVYQTLSQPKTARYVRILPEAWYGHISMRMELYGCSACEAPLGMESEAVTDSQVSASSQLDGQHSAAKARLHFKTDENKDGGWSSHTSDPNQWLQVDFRSYATVARIATQGRHAHNEWVVNYKLNYSDDGVTFQTCRVPGTNISKVFPGNKDSDSVVTQHLNPPITARFLRILPTKWNNRISLRMELYGCAACFAPLGMENNAISDGQISASSQVDEDHAANQARLHAKISGSKGGGWSALKNDPNQWLQVDLGTYTRVTHVATQGRNSFSGWVTKYLLQYSDDGFVFRSYEEAANASAMIFVGNKDSDTVVYNILKPPITARYIRILPLEWHSQISLRIEIYGCPGCVKSLGMENQAISDAQVTASSQMDNTHSAREARLHSKSDGNQRGGWVALKNDLNQWLQVDLGTFTRVTRVATQGRDGYDQWVTKYRLQYSDDGDTFHSFKVITIDSAKVFPGNQDNSTVVYNPLSPPVTTRFIRLIPVGWHSRISMRIEIYGCPGCTAALGMALRTITDAQISASSKLDNTHSAAQARLHSKAEGSKFGAWSALENDHHPWLQIDFGSSTKITRLATQGRNGFNEWVTKYTLEFCEDGVNFHPYKAFQGNQDSDTVVYHTLIPPITARFIRLLPLEWHNHVSLRTEVYGCPGCVDPLGMDSGAITDAQISASSQWDNNHAASRARLHMRYQRRGNKRGAWSSRTNDLNQWLQINLGGYTTLTRVATQGRSDHDQWVTKYRLQYSDDGVIFQFYKEPHQTSAKVFLANKDRNTIAYNILNPPITTRFIRIKPMEWRGHISMRMEIYGCPGCTTPLGMENGAIHDSGITASSSLDNKHTATQARLHLTADSRTGGGWSALKDDFYQWLQIELGGYTTVTRVATQGGNGRNEWVTQYRLKYSRAGNIFKYYKLRENSSAMVFEGNKDSNSVSTNRLSQPIRARYLRFIPIEWHNHISMRVEIYGCPGCIAPLGMENKQISDSQISASSLSDENSSPSKARLHLKEDQNLPGGGGWSALKNDLYQWLQVDLGGYTTLTRVATQGRTGSNEWVTTYKLQYSDDGMNFQFYNEHGDKSAKVFTGNDDSDTVVYNALSPPVTTMFVRVLPIAWNSRISMRIELYGCPGCVSALGIENDEIPDAHITASSQLDDNNRAALARLQLKEDGLKQGGWSALYNDFGQWIQVDLGGSTRVTRVATQGKNAGDAWVVKYRLQYREDLGINFTFVKKSVNSSAKVFYANHDSDTVVYNVLAPPITARLIRILPVEWHNQISMRLEIYGCPVPSSTTTAPPTEQTTKTTSSEKISSTGNEKPEGKLGRSASQRRKDSKISAIVAPVVVFVLVALILLVGFFYWRRRRSNKNLEIQQVTFQKSGQEPLEGAVNPLYDGGELQFRDTKEA